MTIKLTLGTNNYSIAVESNTFTAIKLGIAQGGKNAGEETETTLGYYSQLAAALRRCMREEVASQDEVVDLKEFIERYEAVFEQLKQQFKDVDF